MTGTRASRGRVGMAVVLAAAFALAGVFVPGGAQAKELEGFPVVTQLNITGEPVALTITPSSDSLYVVSRGGDGYLSVFNLTTLELRYVVPLGGHVPLGVASPPSSEGAYISMRDPATGTARVALVPRGSEQVAAMMDAPNAGAMAVGPFGRRIFVADETGSISSFLTANLEFVGMANLGEPIGGMVLSTDETELFVTLPSSRRIAVLDSATFGVKKTMGLKGRPFRMSATPNRGIISVSDQNSNQLTMLEYSTLRRIKDVRMEGQTVSVLHSTSYVLAATSGARSALSAIGLASLDVVGRNVISPNPTALATDPWGRRAYLADSTSSSVTVLDLASPAPGTPSGLQAVGIAKGVEVSWSASAAPGTGAATRFTARVLKTKKVCRTATTSCTFTGLTPGRSYVISVQGSNIRGDGPQATVAITVPRRPPAPGPIGPISPTDPPKPGQSVS